MKHFKQFFTMLMLIAFNVGNVWGAEETATIQTTCWGNTAQSYQTDVREFTDEQGNKWHATGYGVTENTAVVIGKGGANYLETPNFSGNISSISVTWSGNANYYLALQTTSGTELDAKSNVAAGTTATFSVSGSYTQLRLVGRRSSGNSNAAATISKVVVTYSTGSTTPSLTATPTMIDFGTVEQGASVAAKTVTVTYSNLSGSVTYSGLSDAFAASGTGTIAASGDEITISANTSAIGEYEQTLTIQSVDDSKSQEVTVTMNVVEPFDGLVLTFPDYNDKGVSGYTSSWTATKSGQVWNIANFNNNNSGWSLIKAGRNGNASVATITTQVEDHAVSAVTVTVDAVTAAKINSHKLYVADNSSFTGAIEIEGDPATIAAGDIVYTIPVANRDNDLYYKLEYDCASGSSNGFLQISKITYAYGAATPQKQNAGLAYDAADAQKLAKVGGTLTAPTLTNPNSLTIAYASSNTDVVEVNASTGAITAIKAAGTAVITASSEEDATYKAGSATYTIFVATEAGTAENPLTESSAKALIDLGCTLNAHVAGTIKTPAYYSTSQTYTVTLTDDFQFYKLKDLGNQLFTSDYLKANDQLVVLGPLGKHNTTYQLGDGCYIVNYVEYTEPLVDISNTKATAYTVAQALALAGNPTSDLSKAVYIAGVVYQVNSFNSTNGTYNIYIKDAGTSEDDGKFEFYKCSGLYEVGGTPAQFEEGDVQIGDEVIGYGVMTYFSGGSIWEFGQPNQLVSLNRPTVPVTSINLTESTATVEEGKTVTLHASVLPNNATDQDIVWTVVSGDTYASVDNGVVTGIAAGEAVIRAASHEEASIYAECTVTVTEPAPLSPWATVYSSNVTFTAGSNAQDVKVVISETEYDAVKAGTGSKGGNITITVPAHATKLHLHAAGWNGENPTISITAPAGVTVTPASISASADAGIKSSSPFTLEGNPVEQYFALSLSGNTEEVELTFEVSSGNNRFVLYGVNQEGGVLPVLESIEISGDLTTKTGYKVGNDLDLDGLAVSATYSLGGVAQTPVDITDKLGDGLTLTYDPLVEGQTEVTITATYEGETDDINITLDEAVASADPKIYVDKLNVNFGTVAKDAVVADQPITVTLTNVAAATAVLGGTNPEAFSIDKTALVDGDVITISVASTATYGSYSAKITISDNAAEAEAKTVNLSLAVEDVETPVSTISKWVAAEAADLVDGAEVLITGVKDAVTYAMGAQNSNNRAAVAASVDGEGVLTPGEGTMAFVLVKQSEGKFALRTSNGKYLYAAASGSNHMKTQDLIDEDAIWTLSVTSAVAESSTNRNQMKFNGTSLLFSCYSNGQTAIALYTRAKEERAGFTVGKLATVCVPYAVAQEDIIGADVYEIAGKNEAGKIVFDQVVAGGMEAGVAYLVQAKAETATFYYSGDAVAEPQNEGKALKGTFSEIDIAVADAANVYFFKDNALWSAKETGVKILANRAYLQMDEVQPVSSPNPAPGRRRITMDVHGENAATGMDELNASEAPRKMIIDGQLYILRGEKMYNANGTLVK